MKIHPIIGAAFCRLFRKHAFRRLRKNEWRGPQFAETDPRACRICSRCKLVKTIKTRKVETTVRGIIIMNKKGGADGK